MQRSEAREEADGWVLRCEKCSARTTPHKSRPGAICTAVLEGWSIGFGHYICATCQTNTNRGDPA